MVTESDLKKLIEDMANYDADTRFMAARDLTRLVTEHESKATSLQDESSRISSAMQKRIFEAFLKQLGESYADVQSNAVRCIGETLGTFPKADSSSIVLARLAQGMISEPSKTRDVYSTCLKSLPSRLPSSMSQVYCQAVVPIALEGLAKTVVGDSLDARLLAVAVWEDCCDVLCEALQKYSTAPQWSTHHTPLLSRLFTLLQKKDEPTVQKRAVRTIALVGTSLPRTEVRTLVKSLIVAVHQGGKSLPVLTDVSPQVQSPTKKLRLDSSDESAGGVDVHMVRIYVQCLATVAISVEWAVVRYLDSAVAIMLDAIRHALNFDGGEQHSAGVPMEATDEFAELCLSSVASLISASPREMATCLDTLLDDGLLFTLMAYDSNRMNNNLHLTKENRTTINIDNQMESDTVCTGDNTDTSGAEFDFEDGGDAEFNFEGTDYNTGLHSADDTSWKVRRAALSVATPILRACGRRELNGGGHVAKICDALLSRCDIECDNSVKLTLFSAIDDMVVAISNCKELSSVPLSPLFTGADADIAASTPALTIHDSIPWFLGALRIQLQQGLPHQTEAVAYTTLRCICRAFPQSTVRRIAKLRTELITALKSDHLVKAAAMALIRAMLVAIDEVMSFDIMTFTLSLLPSVVGLCKDPKAEIAEQAFFTVTEFVKLLCRHCAHMLTDQETLTSVAAYLQPIAACLLDFADNVVGAVLLSPATQHHAVVGVALQAYSALCIAANELVFLQKPALQYRSTFVQILQSGTTKQHSLVALKSLTSGMKWNYFTSANNEPEACIAEIFDVIIQHLQLSVHTAGAASSGSGGSSDCYVLMLGVIRNLLGKQAGLLAASTVDVPALLKCIGGYLVPRDSVLCNAALDALRMTTRALSICRPKPENANMSYNVLLNSCFPKVIDLCRSPLCTLPTLKVACHFLRQFASSACASVDMTSASLTLLNTVTQDASIDSPVTHGAMGQDEVSRKERMLKMKSIVSALLANGSAHDAVLQWCWDTLQSASTEYTNAAAGTGSLVEGCVDLAFSLAATVSLYRWNCPLSTHASMQGKAFTEIDFYNLIIDMMQHLPSDNNVTKQCATEALSSLVASHVEVLLPLLSASFNEKTAVQLSAAGTLNWLLATFRQVFDRLNRIKTSNKNLDPSQVMADDLHGAVLSPPAALLVKGTTALTVSTVQQASGLADARVLGDCLGALLVYDWNSCSETLHTLAACEGGRIAALWAMKYYLLNKHNAQQPDAERIKYLRSEFLVCMDDHSIEVRKSAWRCIADLSSVVDTICPPQDLDSRALRDIKVDTAHIREVDLGPMVIQEDDGLYLRKAVLQAFTALVKGNHTGFHICFELALIGLKDKTDLRLLSCQMIVEAVNNASPLDLLLPRLNDFGKAIDIALRESRESVKNKPALSQGAADFLRSGVSCMMTITKRIVVAVFPDGHHTVNSKTLEILTESVFGKSCADFLGIVTMWIKEFFNV